VVEEGFQANEVTRRESSVDTNPLDGSTILYNAWQHVRRERWLTEQQLKALRDAENSFHAYYWWAVAE